MPNNYAITIGINYYEHLGQAYNLNYAVGDAERIKEFLCSQKIGFKNDNVILCSDSSKPIGSGSKKILTRPNRSNLRRLLLDEIQRIRSKREIIDYFWFFFSGHGMLGKDNRDYLMTCDAYPRDLEATALDLDFVISRLIDCKAKNVVMVLDMCRRSENSKGNDELGIYTQKIAKHQGIITIFSCGRGEKSYEIPELKQGVFTYSLLEGLNNNHITPKSLEEYLQRRVQELNREYGKREQIPIVALEPFYKYNFPLLPNLKEIYTPPKESVSFENLPVSSVSNLDTDKRSDSKNEKFVRPLVPGISTFDFKVITINTHGRENNYYDEQGYYLSEDLSNGVTLEIVYIDGGEFLMGSQESRNLSEKPPHLVTVQPFLMSKYPITKAQWREIASLPKCHQKLKLSPFRSGSKQNPVTKISWYDAVEFCDRLSHKTGNQYRLPTEAEWEYACRAGTQTPFHFGVNINTDVANFDGTYSHIKGIYREKITPVGNFKFANNFGLFDMHGNVWEWCLDHWHENYNDAPMNGDVWLDGSENQNRVLRGGSYRNEPFLCSSTYRNNADANGMFEDTGFRVVRLL